MARVGISRLMLEMVGRAPVFARRTRVVASRTTRCWFELRGRAARRGRNPDADRAKLPLHVLGHLL